MSTQTQSNVMNVLVGSNPSPIATATVQITDPSNASTYIADGQVVILNHLGVPMQPANANIGDTPYIQFVQRSGTELHFSARIRGIDITNAKGKSYVAAQEQIWSIGYNGVSGSIDNTSTEYFMNIVYTFDDMEWSEQQLKEPYEYITSVPTQKGIAQSFSYQINFAGTRKILAGTGPFVKAEMLADGTTQGSANAASIAVVNGSDIFTFSAAQTTTILAVGNVIRTVTPAATTTGTVYVVIANSATDSTLSSATGATPQIRVHTIYEGPTATLTTRGTDWDFITGSTNFGIKLTGLPLTWIKDFFKFKKVIFHFDLRSWGMTTISKTQESSLGNGDYRLVSEFESFAAGNEGALNRMMVPLPLGRTDTVTGATYDTLELESVDRKSNAVAGINGMRYQLYVFIPDGATQETQLLLQLNPYLASTPAALPPVTL